MHDLAIDAFADRLPAETSFGQQQRAVVARAIAIRPLILLADEPTSHQDEANGNVVMQALRRCVDAGAACLVAGHDPRLATIADRTLFLADGDLIPVATPPPEARWMRIV
jgi:ABC-type lipoprotein export system ATPase subunit